MAAPQSDSIRRRQFRCLSLFSCYAAQPGCLRRFHHGLNGALAACGGRRCAGWSGFREPRTPCVAPRLMQTPQSKAKALFTSLLAVLSDCHRSPGLEPLCVLSLLCWLLP